MIFPGRIFGGDHYNPITNSVHIFSNHPAIILHELGHALDYRNRKYPGIYSFFGFVPIVSLYKEFVASKFVFNFLKKKKYYKEELAAYRTLFPAYSTYVAGSIFEYIPTPIIISLFTPFIILGHIIGQFNAYNRKNELKANGIILDDDPLESILSGLNINWIIMVIMVAGFIFGSRFFPSFNGIYGGVLGGILGSFLSYLGYYEFLQHRFSRCV